MPSALLATIPVEQVRENSLRDDCDAEIFLNLEACRNTEVDILPMEIEGKDLFDNDDRAIGFLTDDLKPYKRISHLQPQVISLAQTDRHGNLIGQADNYFDMTSLDDELPLVGHLDLYNTIVGDYEARRGIFPSVARPCPVGLKTSDFNNDPVIFGQPMPPTIWYQKEDTGQGMGLSWATSGWKGHKYANKADYERDHTGVEPWKINGEEPPSGDGNGVKFNLFTNTDDASLFDMDEDVFDWDSLSVHDDMDRDDYHYEYNPYTNQLIRFPSEASDTPVSDEELESDSDSDEDSHASSDSDSDNDHNVPITPPRIIAPLPKSPPSLRITPSSRSGSVVSSHSEAFDGDVNSDFPSPIRRRKRKARRDILRTSEKKVKFAELVQDVDRSLPASRSCPKGPTASLSPCTVPTSSPSPVVSSSNPMPRMPLTHSSPLPPRIPRVRSTRHSATPAAEAAGIQLLDAESPAPTIINCTLDSHGRLVIPPYAHTKNTKFRCPHNDCGKLTGSIGDMGRHLQALRHKPPSYECSGCHFKYTRSDALLRHQANSSGCRKAKKPSTEQTQTTPRTTRNQSKKHLA